MSTREIAAHHLMQGAVAAAAENRGKPKTAALLQALAGAVAAQGRHVSPAWVEDFSAFVHAAHRKGKH